MSRNTTKFARCYYFKLTTCFGPCCGPSSGHNGIYSRKLYNISHKIYQSKTQQDLVVVQYPDLNLVMNSIRILNNNEILLSFRLIYFLTYTV